MTEEELRRRFIAAFDLVILSNTRINYLNQLLDLVREKNHILMIHQGFFTMVIRDMNTGFLAGMRALVEKRNDTHNIRTLCHGLREWSNQISDHGAKEKLLEAVNELEAQSALDVVRIATIIANASYLHRTLKVPPKLAVTYKQAKEWLEATATILNKISGILWNSGTVPYVYGSEEDAFSRELRHMELAELAGSHLLRLDEEHQAVEYAKRLISRKDRR